MPEIFWLPGPWKGRLGISTRPRGGDWLEADACVWQQSGADIVVSLLSADEVRDLNLEEERRLTEGKGIQFVSFPVTDRGIPSSTQVFLQLLQNLLQELERGRSVIVHCRQGIGRSALVAAGVMIVAGLEPREAVSIVSKTRGIPVPETEEQRNWLERSLTNQIALAKH